MGMASSRNQILHMVLETFDSLDRLEHENAMLRDRVKALEGAQPEDVRRLSQLDELVLAHGRKALMRDALEYWHEVHCYEDEDSDEVSIESYDKWLGHAIKKDKIPSWCSRDEFRSYFDVELRETYAGEREKAVAKAQGRKK